MAEEINNDDLLGLCRLNQLEENLVNPEDDTKKAIIFAKKQLTTKIIMSAPAFTDEQIKKYKNK